MKSMRNAAVTAASMAAVLQVTNTVLELAPVGPTGMMSNIAPMGAFAAAAPATAANIPAPHLADDSTTAASTNPDNDRPGVDVYRVNIAQAPTVDGGLEVQHDRLVGVRSGNGTIMFIVDAGDKDAVASAAQRFKFDRNLVMAGDHSPENTTFVVPGFFDAHVHAPQFGNTGLGYDTELLPWLNDYTFPLEDSFDNPADGYKAGAPGTSPESYVEQAYERVVKKMLNQGTTTASYYATHHPHASFVLAKEVARQGQRAYVGKVNTDVAPMEEQNESIEKSLQGTRDFIKLVQGLNSPTVTPVISPRYGLGVSWELMEKLGDLAREYNLPVQAHLDENQLEVIDVAKRFPNTTSYADLYAQTGLFNVSHMILGHCVHLTDNEITEILKYPGVGCAPCPLSNFALDSGIAPIRHFLNRGLPTGLGTDVGGGYSSSPLESMRAAIAGSKALYFQHNRTKEWARLDFDSAMYLATKGSADVMGLGDKVGLIKPGYQWDALFVDITAPGSPTSMDYNKFAGKYGPAYSVRELVSKFVYEGDDRNIVRVFVDGKKVKDITGKN